MPSLVRLLLVALVAVLAACGASPVPVEAEAVAAPMGPPGPGWRKPDDAALRARLTPMQYEVTQHDATEPPFQNEYWDEHREGLFVDVVSGDPLFSSADKFDSGTGWPSFTKPISPDAVTTRTDTSLFMTRVEVRSRLADSHLGHVFDDGPNGRTRWCIDSAALRFVPYDRMDAEGYGAWKSAVRTGQAPLAPATDNTCAKPTAAPAPGAMTAGKPGCATTFETAILAGGCFWGMEDILREIPGVIQTDVGYTGGSTPKPTYEDVHTGLTGHAEAVRVVFDPTKLSYADLLEKWFFRMHDPTTKDRQGNDVGSQYRSAIFTTTPEQAKTAAAIKAKVAASGFWKRPLVTEIEPAGTWTPAEGYHQDYLEKNPGGYTCHYMR